MSSDLLPEFAHQINAHHQLNSVQPSSMFSPSNNRVDGFYFPPNEQLSLPDHSSHHSVLEEFNQIQAPNNAATQLYQSTPALSRNDGLPSSKTATLPSIGALYLATGVQNSDPLTLPPISHHLGDQFNNSIYDLPVSVLNSFITPPFPIGAEALDHIQDNNHLQFQHSADLEPSHDDCISWASRNPTMSKIVPRKRNAPITDLSEAQRTQKEINAKKREEHEAAFKQALSQSEFVINAEVDRIATQFHKNCSDVEAILLGQSQFQKGQKPTLHNAILHAISKKVQVDPSLSGEECLAFLRNAIKNDPDLSNPTEELKEQLIQDLIQYRLTMTKGARISNVAVGKDVQNTVQCMASELHNLSLRTGIYAFAFFARSSVDDPGMSSFIESSGSPHRFFQDVLKMTTADIVCKFELWATTDSKNVVERENKGELKKDVSALVLTGLRDILKVSHAARITMSYENYDKDIVEKYSVRLIGWPEGILLNPNKINEIGTLRTLKKQLELGQIRWIVLSADELDTYLKSKYQDGPVPKRPRKERSDKGKKRGSSKRDKENVRPSELTSIHAINRSMPPEMMVYDSTID